MSDADNDRYAAIARRLMLRARDICRQRGLDVTTLARMCAIPRPNLSRMLNGRHIATLPNLVRVSDALGVPLAQLAHGVENADDLQPPPPPGPVATHEHLADLLREHGGRTTHVSRALGCSHATVRRMIDRYGIDVAAYRGGPADA
jgi:transcriptional regulator with XRE-family HTH domain